MYFSDMFPKFNDVLTNSRLSLFFKIGVLKNLTNLTVNHLC